MIIIKINCDKYVTNRTYCKGCMLDGYYTSDSGSESEYFLEY